MNSVGQHTPSIKYQRFTPSGCRDIWIRIFPLSAIHTLSYPSGLEAYSFTFLLNIDLFYMKNKNLAMKTTVKE